MLSDNLANKIAAGEVVERPASVVKELLENTLDAGAKRIQIDIESGGRRLIRISDDGEGMSKDDSILAFERHATSKLRTFEDFSNIATLGFRGEALASISSVAKVELTTKTIDDRTATRVQIDGGKLIDVSDAARPTGTTISVRDLFFNVPARRKFMRSEATENYHLVNIVTHYALVHPEISFILTNNGREILHVSPTRELRERAFQIFGADLLESFLRVEGGNEYIATVTGFVSAPRERRSTRDSQYFFINGRFVKDKILATAVSEGYRAILPHGVYPVAVLFLDIPREEVDVNVHPAKTEVRFRRAEAVKETVAEAIRKVLVNQGFVRETMESVSESEHFRENHEEIPFQSTIDFSAQIQTEIVAHENRSEPIAEKIGESSSVPLPIANLEFDAFSDDFEEKARVLDEKFQISIPQTKPLEISRNSFSDYAEMPPVNSAAKLVREIDAETLSTNVRALGQMHESYIVAVDAEGLLLLDQHVVHERILFDKFRKREENRPAESQSLLVPETFDLSPAQAIAFDLVETELEENGFGLMRLSGRTVAIKATPADLPANEARNLLSEILNTVDAEKRGYAKENLRDDIAATMACKAAVKVNMKLTLEKMQWMIDKLVLTSNATTCPHGRPIVLRLTMKDIERGFHRT